MSATAPSRPRRVLTWKHKLLLLGTAALLACVALEGAIRVRQYLKFGSFGPIFDFEIDAESGLRVPKPGKSGNVTVTARGFRAPDVDVPKPEGCRRIVFLGGSTTYCAEVSGDAAAWPQQVVAGLHTAYPGADLDGLNAAAPGYDTGSSLRNLQHRVAAMAPDVVVVYHGTNDLAKDSRAQAEAAGVWEKVGEGWLERNSMAWSLIVKNLRIRARASQGDDAAETLDFDLAAATQAFEQRLRALVAAAEERADLVAVATFSHRLRPEMDAAARQAAAASALYYMPFLTSDSILAGIEAYNAVIREVCADTGALLIDDPHRIPADAEHYTDSVHLTDQGCVVMAQRVLDALRGSERFRALLGE